MDAVIAKALDILISNGPVAALLLYLHFENKKVIAAQQVRIDNLTDKFIDQGISSAKVIAANTISSETEARALEAMDSRLENVERIVERNHA